MDTARWKHGDEFPILDLVAQFRFRTASSLSFDLGKLFGPEDPRPPEMDEELWEFLHEDVRIIIAWLDAHHPCEGFHRLQLRVGLPERYICWESLRDLAVEAKAALGLPVDEPYYVELAGLSRRVVTEDPQSGFVSTTRWKPPN
jgi:hypothetical protein